jgi:hypothetical protein
MRTLPFFLLLALAGTVNAEAGPETLQLYLDPDSGQVSSTPTEGSVALGTYVADDQLLEQQAAMQREMKSLHQRLQALEAKTETPSATQVAQAETPPAADAGTAASSDGLQELTLAAQGGDEPRSLRPTYYKRKLKWRSADGDYEVALQNRMQMRFASPFDSSPRRLGDLDTDTNSYDLRRIRTAFSGNIFDPRLKFHIEHDWNETVIRDFFFNIELNDYATLWLGRGKAHYNTEFWISSGRQQFIERSIAHGLFTLNRQQGAQLQGRLFRDTPLDLSYVLGAFTGRGGAEGSNDDSELMLTSRLQWNALGGDIGSAHADLALSAKPRLNLAVATMSNRSDCTRFGSGANGCRTLPGFQAGEAGQFDIEQAVAELRFHWQGFSLETELNRKEVTDRFAQPGDPMAQTTLEGGFIQLGMIPHAVLRQAPPQLDFAFRYAQVDQGDFRGNDDLEEFTGVANWYFDGHHNKVSLEFAHIDLEDPLLQQQGSENRVRLQWDVRF